jgi:hypothetical protein
MKRWLLGIVLSVASPVWAQPKPAATSTSSLSAEELELAQYLMLLENLELLEEWELLQLWPVLEAEEEE